jgi:hypothetical protein
MVSRSKGRCKSAHSQKLHAGKTRHQESLKQIRITLDIAFRRRPPIFVFEGGD